MKYKYNIDLENELDLKDFTKVPELAANFLKLIEKGDVKPIITEYPDNVDLSKYMPFDGRQSILVDNNLFVFNTPKYKMILKHLKYNERKEKETK